MARPALELASSTPPVPKPIYGAQPVGDAVLDAAAICVERKGFDNTSLEEVANEAGVSRTTLYRRFGNRESLFAALLFERAAPFRKWSHEVLVGPGTVAERLETVITHAVLELQRVGWLDQSFRAGLTPASARLIKAAHAESARSGMGPVLETIMRAHGAEEHGIAVDEVLSWIADQMIALAGADPWEEDALRKRVRFFVTPVLRGPEEQSVDQRLAAIEAKLDRIVPD